MTNIRNVTSLAIILEAIGAIMSVSITDRGGLTVNEDEHSELAVIPSTDNRVATQPVLGSKHVTTLARGLQVITDSSALELAKGNPSTIEFKSSEKSMSSTPSMTNGHPLHQTTSFSQSTSLVSSDGTSYHRTVYHIEEAHNRVFHAVLGICSSMVLILLMVFVGGLIYARQHGWYGPKRSAVKREESIFLNPPRRVVY